MKPIPKHLSLAPGTTQLHTIRAAFDGPVTVALDAEWVARVHAVGKCLSAPSRRTRSCTP